MNTPQPRTGHPPAQAKNSPASLSQTPNDPNYKWKVLISVAFGIFMIILDSTVVNVAFQTLRREFGGTLADSQWVLSIYVLSLGITTPMSGFLGDRFGTKRVYLFGLAIFTLGSFLCGIAPSLPMLIAARALQGIGGGIAQPLGPAMLYRAFPPNEIGKALGLFGLVLVVGPALGPLMGGALVDVGLWRLIFFINLPIGIIGVFLGSRFLRNDKAAKKPAFDPLGLVLSVVGFGSVLYAASTAEVNGGLTAPATLTWFGIGAVALIAFAIVELFVVKEPLLNLRLFGNRVFTNATLVGYVTTVALFGAEFIMPIYLQALRGRTALESGTILLAVALASGITTPLAGRLYDKIGPRPMIVVGFALLILNTWQLSQLTATTPISTIVILLGIRGLAVGATLQTTFTTALGAVPRDQLPRGSSLQNSTRFVVQAVSVAALATVLSSQLSPAVKQQQDAARSTAATTATAARFGVCETPGVATEDNIPAAALDAVSKAPAATQAAAKQKIRAGLQLACDENISGVEATYRITFYAAVLALIVGAFLPGWPGKWTGRAAMQAGQQGQPVPVVAGH